jgi:branched-chain amino acid transport system substrate-binding protein
MTRAAVVAAAALGVAFGLGACGQEKKQPAERVPAARSIKSPGCSPVTYGGPGKPQVLIAASTTLQGQFVDHGVQVAQALKFVLAQRGWHAGPYRVGVQICDETTSKSDFSDPAKCRSNARAFARNRAVVVVLGPLFSGCTGEMLPILNHASGGPVPMVGSSATYLGLTRSGPGVGPGEPAKYYPTGTRNYVRIVPADDVQAAAAAMYVKRKGATRAFVLSDGEPYGDGAAEAFAISAKRLGIPIVGAGRWNPKARDYRRLAERVRRTGPDVVYMGGYVFENTPRLIKDVRRVLPRAQLIGPDGMNQPATVVEGAGDAAENFLATIAVHPVRALPPPGRTFAGQFRRRYAQYPCCYSMFTAQSEQMALDAIARAGRNRARVMAKLRAAHVKGGLIGDFTIDRYGDTTLTRIGVYRIVQGTGRFDSSVSPPASLLARH